MRPFLNRTRSSTLGAASTPPVPSTTTATIANPNPFASHFDTLDHDPSATSPPTTGLTRPRRNSKLSSLTSTTVSTAKSLISNLPLRRNPSSRKLQGKYTDMDNHNDNNDAPAETSVYARGNAKTRSKSRSIGRLPSPEGDDEGDLPAWRPPVSSATYTATVTTGPPTPPEHNPRFLDFSSGIHTDNSPSNFHSQSQSQSQSHPTPPGILSPSPLRNPASWIRARRARAYSAPPNPIPEGRVQEVQVEPMPVPVVTGQLAKRLAMHEEKGRLRRDETDTRTSEEDAEYVGGYPYPYGRDSFGRDSYDAYHVTEQRSLL